MSQPEDPRVARVRAAVEREADSILGYFARRVTPAEDAADLLSETLLVLWRRAAALPKEDAEVRPWMFGIARKVLARHDRTTARRHALADRLRDELAAVPAPGLVVDDPRLDALRGALAVLDRSDLDLVGLVHWEGFSLTEAAGILGLKPVTARSRYRRARLRLRDAVLRALAADAALQDS